MIYVNVRGCNGSGKTHLLRLFATGTGCEVRYLEVADHKPIPVTFTPHGLAIIGDYTPAAAGATTAGLDRVKTQAAAKAVIEAAGREPNVKAVLFEGVVVSTIYGPWQEWSERNGGMIWAFLDTPLEACLSRIQRRNGGKPIKEDQVAAKHRTIQRVREKALAAGEKVRDIRWHNAWDDLHRVLRFGGVLAEDSL